MRRNRRHIDQLSNPDRGNASGVEFENMHRGRIRLVHLLKVVSSIFVAVVSLVLNATHAQAAFVLPDGAKSIAELTDLTGCSVSMMDVLSLCSDPAMGNRRSNMESGSAGNSRVPVSDTPAIPSRPWGGRPSEMVFTAGFTFGASERSSTGASGNSTGGGSSGALGVFCSSWRMQGQQLLGWLKVSECFLIPSAPSSDIFRPPPIAASQLS